MLVRIRLSQVFDRPLAEVFQFYAYEHVRNHPRWDPEMELEQVSDGPIGVGIVIRRLNSHSGTPVEGTMEVVEFEHNRSMGVVIHDGPVETRGLATFEAESQCRTTLKFDVEFPGMDDSMDTSMITSMIERSLGNMKRLIESEV
ncbi:MAG: SRPBCC family protein [Candidatus Promineifilaceae bacterium]